MVKYLGIEEFHLLGYNLCGLLKVNQRFRGTYRLHLQGQRISQVRNQLCLLPASTDFLLGLFFDFEDGGNMFHRNIG
jgi:hypothetical protein